MNRAADSSPRARRSRWTLAFIDPALERDYRAEQFVSERRSLRVGLATSTALWSLAAAVLHQLHLPRDRDILELILLGIVPFVAGGLIIALRARSGAVVQVVGLLVNLVALGVILATAYLTGDFQRYAVPAVAIIILYALLLIGLRWVTGVSVTGIGIVVFGVSAALQGEPPNRLAVDVFLVLAIACVSSVGAYLLEDSRRETFYQRKKSDDLLRNILPASIADRLKREPGIIADRFDEVTVVFADVVGFTPLAANVGPERLVGILNEIFTRFDDLVARHGVEKIKTIGDAYMAVAGLPERRADHAHAIADLALEMRASIESFCAEGELEIKVRIGVCSGPAVAGVIGLRKFAYDLWGDTVNTAARMESHGVAGEIQVAEPTYHALAGSYSFEERGEIDIKGKGRMRTWLLRSKVAGSEGRGASSL